MELTDVQYKETEIGVIPIDWEIKPLGEVCKIFGRIGFRGYTTNDIVEKEQGAITLSPSNIKDDRIDYSNCTYISWFKYEESPEIKIFNGDILLVKTGSTFGKTAIVKDLPEKATLNPQIVVLKRVRIDNGFLGYVMSYDVVQNQINKSIVGGAIPTLSQAQVSMFKIPLPPTKSEQNAIATALSDTDVLIENLEKLIAKKRNIKQGVMQELLKPKTEWKKQKLGELLEYEQPTKYLVKDSEYNDNNLVPVLTAGKTFILGYTDEDFGIYENLPVIIFDDFTTATKFVTFPFKAKSSAMKMLKAKNKLVNLRLIYEIMQTVNFPLSDHKRYWISEFQNIEVNVPSPHEQEFISQIMSDMDFEIESLENELKKYKMVKQGMMNSLLTGKIRLT